VRIIPAQKKYRRKKAGIAPWRGDLRRKKSTLSRPIIGHTPRKLPPFGAISRIIAVAWGHNNPNTSSFIIQDSLLFVNRFFYVFYELS
jgi:hypothetical protein